MLRHREPYRKLHGLIIFLTLLVSPASVGAHKPALSNWPIESPNFREFRDLSYPYIAADLPWAVKQGESFQIDVWLATPDSLSWKADSNSPVTVYMEQTDKVFYNPRVFDLIPGHRKTVEAKIIDSPSGLTEIIASADGWKPLSVTIDSGFKLHIASSTFEELLSGARDTFSVQFFGDDNKLIRLDAPASVVIEATSAEIRYGNGDWGRTLEIPIARGANSTPLVEIRPSVWPPSRGFIKVDLKINSQQVIGSDVRDFRIVPSWWLALTMAAIGGLFWSLYDTFRKFNQRARSNRVVFGGKQVFNLVAGGIAGSMAYLLASWEVLGIKVDTTSLRGFLLLGFMVSYIGIEGILKKIAPEKER